MAMHPRLAKAPVIEALFELRGKFDRPFSLIPGRMAEALAADYPETIETELAKFGSIFAEYPTEAPFIVSHQFKTPDGKRLVQIGPMGIAVNSLAYTAFADFRASVSSAIETYYSVALIKGISRVGLRYLNRVPAKDGAFLGGLTVKLDWPPLNSAKATSLAARMVFSYDDPPGQLGAALAGPNPETTLDLDFSFTPHSELALRQVLSWIDRAHERIYEAFTALVSPALMESWK
jgi:uncharacterized protein (TIGR04255 family)